ncbi:D-sedoheptulose 7-phosphate isomerase [Roseomonas elaeocarpi]|uniref:Phosphoheptose isomerase n=1 Tax=Roseomonas elaeocarpi TaxID=907779 RepID=A0ABV6JSG2_9PROT
MHETERRYARDYLAESVRATEDLAADTAAQEVIFRVAEATCRSLRAGGKLLLAGNGGSAADAQHIATEFVSRLMYDRAPLAAIALTTDTSALTAIGNDYGFDQVFARQVRAIGRPGDVFLGITTSGRSPNILLAAEAAREMGLHVFGFTGRNGGALAERCDATLLAPAGQTAVVQQLHITAAHVVCALVERHFFPPSAP